MLSGEQMRPLLQKLLQQRFKLTAHRESRSVAGFALVVAKGGAKLQGSKDGDKPFFYILSNGVEGRATSMVTLAAVLERPSGRPVIDKTGIAGKYDITVHYAPANDPKSDLPDLFTAVQAVRRGDALFLAIVFRCTYSGDTLLGWRNPIN
jgi:uncharacterized protein (TIGR03435 family)